MFSLDHVVLHIATDAVLGTKECYELDFLILVHQVSYVMVVMVHRRLIADQSNSRVLHEKRLLFQQSLNA
jgi:hypothetical protein